MPCCPCHLRHHSRLPSHPCCLVVALYSPSPRRRLAPPFARHRHHHFHVTSDDDGDRHRHRRSLSLPVLLPPPTLFFPPPSPLPLLPLSGCVCRAGCSGGTATPAVIRDGPDGRTTKTRYGTASAAGRQRRRRRSATDATAPTPGAAWTTPSSAWWTADGMRQRRAPRRRRWGVR